MHARLNFVKAAPDGMAALGELRTLLANGALSPQLVELVYLRVSQINDCAYCIDAHFHALVADGVRPEKLALLPVWREAAPLLSKQEQGALAWTETVTQITHGVSDAEFEAASASFSEAELAELTIAIGLMNAYNRLAISFRSPPESVRRLSTTPSA